MRKTEGNKKAKRREEHEESTDTGAEGNQERKRKTSEGKASTEAEVHVSEVKVLGNFQSSGAFRVGAIVPKGQLSLINQPLTRAHQSASAAASLEVINRNME